jgi:hypothetical protein
MKHQIELNAIVLYSDRKAISQRKQVGTISFGSMYFEFHNYHLYTVLTYNSNELFKAKVLMYNRSYSFQAY